jgi:hypothetical protein
MSEPPTEYRSMSTDEILDNLAIQIYEPPLSKLREGLRSVPEVLRIPVLIIDFGGTVRPSALVVLRFTMKSTFVTCVVSLDHLVRVEQAAMLGNGDIVLGPAHLHLAQA